MAAAVTFVCFMFLIEYTAFLFVITSTSSGGYYILIYPMQIKSSRERQIAPEGLNCITNEIILPAGSLLFLSVVIHDAPRWSGMYIQSVVVAILDGPC